MEDEPDNSEQEDLNADDYDEFELSDGEVDPDFAFLMEYSSSDDDELDEPGGFQEGFIPHPEGLAAGASKGVDAEHEQVCL